MNLMSLLVLNELDRMMSLLILVIIRGYTKWLHGSLRIMQISETKSMYFNYHIIIVLLITIFNMTHQMVTLHEAK